ncbi:ATP-binding protein [Streptomyces cavernicola]|uniref:ATP-binding protein n=1 Tax=Streptomyces cavernicola TaxID=3043613 RepID=A0ABT6S9Y3_9ACTN|nr:ATP-binding protein [Streptomyces sp. B-S-A6]MDI3404965.1 ATP-binding protein [Streptomyces sp. B-S-A6]
MRAPGRNRRRTARVEYHLPQQPNSAHRARQLTRLFLAARGPGRPPYGADPGSAVLVVSELVTNATRYGEGSCRLRLSLDSRDRLVVEVHDHGPGRPQLAPPSPTAEGGRGITLVQALSRSLSVVRDGEGAGKTVRAELTCAYSE